jgi:hypothetical protein
MNDKLSFQNDDKVKNESRRNATLDRKRCVDEHINEVSKFNDEHVDNLVRTKARIGAMRKQHYEKVSPEC